MPHIESIEKYKGRTMKLTLSEGEPAFMNADIIARYGLKGGIDVPESAWKEIIHADVFRRARERAMYLLDYRDYSYADLVKKLMDNYEEDICFEVADDLAEHGFINDRRYAENLARKLCETKLLGEYRARMYMREKGIPSSIIEEALVPYSCSGAERPAELAERKYMKYFDPGDRQTTEKLKNALARQGYSFSDIKEAIELLKERFTDGG